MIQRVGRHVLELGGHRGAGLRQSLQRLHVVVGGAQVLVRCLAGRAVAVRVEHNDAIAHFMRGQHEEAAELTAAEHAEGCGRKNHLQRLRKIRLNFS